MVGKVTAGLAGLVVLTMLVPSTMRQGLQDMTRSLTHLNYYPIRDMRRTVALSPQKVVTRAPDSLSIPVSGRELPPVGADGHALFGAELNERLGAILVNPVASDDSSVARGERRFLRVCAPCHGASLKGDGTVTAKFIPPPDLLAAQSRGRQDGWIYSYVRNGGAVMPMYGHIVTAQETWEIINYLRHMQKVSPR